MAWWASLDGREAALAGFLTAFLGDDTLLETSEARYKLVNDWFETIEPWHERVGVAAFNNKALGFLKRPITNIILTGPYAAFK
jgi:hypothetical protein